MFYLYGGKESILLILLLQYFILKLTACTINMKFSGIRQQDRAYRRLLPSLLTPPSKYFIKLYNTKFFRKLYRKKMEFGTTKDLIPKLNFKRQGE